MVIGDVFFDAGLSRCMYSAESEYISTKDVAHALEIRGVLAECDITLKMKG